MRRATLILTLGLLTLVVAVACGPGSQGTPAAPPDQPSLAPEEAISLVRDWLAQRSYQLTVREGETVLLQEESTCLNLYRQLQDWREEYLGRGTWLVSVSAGDYQWVVNERSGVVSPLRVAVFQC